MDRSIAILEIHPSKQTLEPSHGEVTTPVRDFSTNRTTRRGPQSPAVPAAEPGGAGQGAASGRGASGRRGHASPTFYPTDLLSGV